MSLLKHEIYKLWAFLDPCFLSTKESKDLCCKSLHFVYIWGKLNQKKVCKLANFILCIYMDASILFLLTLVFLKLKVSLYLQGTCKCFYHWISFSNALLRIFGESVLNEDLSPSYTTGKFIHSKRIKSQ